jgi:2-polyprenyl-3-methyl-5-hydroxy-6-metoxy-1,4-benzoquinol methylase
VPPRQMTPERMDDPALDPREHARALVGLARINRWTGSAGMLWPTLREEARSLGRPLRLLDVATGSGDIPVSLAKRALRTGIKLDVSGCDVSETAIVAATRRATKANVKATFFRHDVLIDPLPTGYDIITASLFLHHLTEDDVIRVLKTMADAAGRMVVISDLSRGSFNLGLVWIGCRLLSRSPVVHFDGPVSVKAAFTPKEASELATRASLTGATVTPRFPCRWLLTWKKPQ